MSKKNDNKKLDNKDQNTSENLTSAESSSDIAKTENQARVNQKKKLTFGKVLLIYVAVWLLVTVVVCIILYGKCSGYQKNYEAAKAETNPDLVAEAELARFSRDSFLETAGEEFLGINNYESKEGLGEYADEIYASGDVRYVRSADFSETRPVYDIYAGRINIGAMSLKQKAGMDGYGFHSFEFGEAAFYVERPKTEGYFIKAFDTDEIYINGNLLEDTDEYVTVTSENNLNKQKYQLASKLTGKELNEKVYYVRGFVTEPEIKFIRDGVEYQAVNSLEREIPITLSEEERAGNYYNLCHYYSEDMDNTLKAKLYNGFLAAVQAYLLNMNKYGDYSDASKYFNKSGPGIKLVASIQKEMKWEGKPDQFAITSAEITELIQYDENTVVVTTHHSMFNVYKGTIYNDDIDIQWLYTCENGKWYIYDFAYV